MKIYLVGGAVRDQLLGRPIMEKDWVVVGGTAADLLKLGFLQVGKEFPVFLHPKTKEEYALARTERKIGRGYTGFEFHADQSVTLEEDLKRRDVTINAMAQMEDGTLIDPYQGATDLKNRLLRHVSEAFAEDPVRILRVARFAARFGFEVASETMTLMRSMVDSGEIDALVPERVWKELERALSEPYPEKFFEVLHDCGALAVLFPDITSKGLAALKKATLLSSKTRVRFAGLLHDLTENGINAFCERYRLPREYRELALVVFKCLPLYEPLQSSPAESVSHALDFLVKADAFRRPERFKDVLIACEACQHSSYSAWWWQAYEVTKAIDIRTLTQETPREKIAEKIQEKRREALLKSSLFHSSSS